MPLYLRRLKRKERELLQEILKDGNSYPPQLKKRAKIIYLAADGWISTELALQVECHPNIVRKWIRRFNKEGIKILEVSKRPGSPSRISAQIKREIVNIVATDPLRLGLSFRRWSLNRVIGYLVKEGIITSISRERLRQLLIEAGFTYKRPYGWVCMEANA